MNHHQPRFDPMPERANDAALDLALRPFVERYIKEDKHARATTLCLPTHPRAECRELLPLIDTRRGRTYVDADLAPWHAVRGVFLVDKDAFSVDAKTAFGLYVTDPWLFVAYGATFAVIHWEVGQSLLFT
jgi:hypothetical protein